MQFLLSIKGVVQNLGSFIITLLGSIVTDNIYLHVTNWVKKREI
jgi:hypothetical protein